MALKDLKSRILKLLREDEEFRYAVAGLIGLEEVLKRLDRHEAELIKLREDMNRLIEDMNRLREDMNRGFELMERRISALGGL
jgi:ribosomal protein L7Ae-like RNA K-turn-binding protein